MRTVILILLTALTATANASPQPASQANLVLGIDGTAFTINGKKAFHRTP